jgi:hypothetical protein
MGFRFQKRINLGGGAGINLSKSGAGFSFRTKYGSFGNKGYSVRTGIPGLSYRGGSGKNNPLGQILAIFWIIYMLWPLIWAFIWFSLWPFRLAWFLLMCLIDLIIWIVKKLRTPPKPIE